MRLGVTLFSLSRANSSYGFGNPDGALRGKNVGGRLRDALEPFQTFLNVGSPLLPTMGRERLVIVSVVSYHIKSNHSI
jgi:hypothetical protein